MISSGLLTGLSGLLQGSSTVSFIQGLSPLVPVLTVGTIAVSLFLLAARIFFNTGDFEEEYQAKIRQIRSRYYDNFEEELGDLIEARDEQEPDNGDGDEERMPVFDPYDQMQETADVREAAQTVGGWSEVLEKGKKYLRLTGVSLFLTAVFLLASMIVFTVSRSASLALGLGFYTVGLPAVSTIVYFGRYLWLTREIDNEYVEAKQLGGDM